MRHFLIPALSGVLCVGVLAGCATPPPATAPLIYDAQRVTVYAVVNVQPLNGIALTKGAQEFVLWSSDNASPLRPATSIYQLQDVRWAEPELPPAAIVQLQDVRPQPPQPPQLPQVELAPQKKMVVQLHVPFNTNSPTLSDAASRLLELTIKDSVVQILRIEGHADSTGSEAGNEKLAAARAGAVAASIRQLAPELALPIAVSHGARKPLSSNNTVEGRALNRRVDLTLSAQERADLLVGNVDSKSTDTSRLKNEAN